MHNFRPFFGLYICFDVDLSCCWTLHFWIEFKWNKSSILINRSGKKLTMLSTYSRNLFIWSVLFYLLRSKNDWPKSMISKTLQTWTINIAKRRKPTPLTKHTNIEFVYSQNVFASYNTNIIFKKTFRKGNKSPISNRPFRRWFRLKPMNAKHFWAYWRVSLVLLFFPLIIFCWLFFGFYIQFFKLCLFLCLSLDFFCLKRWWIEILLFWTK